MRITVHYLRTALAVERNEQWLERCYLPINEENPTATGARTEMLRHPPEHHTLPEDPTKLQNILHLTTAGLTFTFRSVAGVT